MTGHGLSAAELNRGGQHQPTALKPVISVIPPGVIALDRWVNEGGCGDDPDTMVGLNQRQLPPRPQEG
ncbi:hypothetical protein EHF33_14880 [Deinococcus psychrotolerans]|uniref:Uncharacterized protein n=1 Tax=Deinococcus psychrotolerans TaxID=2489213 RepID=A0A3G8YGT9_9DEIO|nr:hypothetical protein [Deinococcus psychrotolerans]AZI44183.1 hypothetical protein EHF33_14880 [Deinococcus psychrotolerans]